MKNHTTSAMSVATTLSASARTKLKGPSTESAPAASSTGVAGNGMPNCSTNTQAKSSKYP